MIAFRKTFSKIPVLTLFHFTTFYKKSQASIAKRRPFPTAFYRLSSYSCSHLQTPCKVTGTLSSITGSISSRGFSIGKSVQNPYNSCSHVAVYPKDSSYTRRAHKREKYPLKTQPCACMALYTCSHQPQRCRTYLVFPLHFCHGKIRPL